MNLLNHFKRLDWILIASAVALAVFGLLSLYSSSLRAGNFDTFTKQAIFLAIGFLLAVVLSFFDWRMLKGSSSLVLGFYFVSILALAGVYFFGSVTRSTLTWYKIGMFSFDPIEPAKFALLVLFAKYFSSRHISMYQIRHILLTGFYAAVPVSLIFFQPNLGPCLVIFALWIGMLVISGIKLRHFLALTVCFLLITALAWAFLLKDYQRARVMSFFVPYDPLGISWSQNQSKIAVAIGGIFGKGIGQGSQTQYGFLSEPQTDFIFSAITEEMGLIGAIVLVLLLLLLAWRATRAALMSQDNFSRLFCAGFVVLFCAESAIHIGVNIGFLPIIGLPLPLVSYGGSTLITTFAMLGILESIVSHPNIIQGR